MVVLHKKYKDMAKVMAIVCSKTSSYFYMWKQVINIPLIFISGILSVLNSNISDFEVLRYLNITCNLLTAILIGLNNNMKFAERANLFNQLSNKFSKLEHAIEQAVNINDLTNDKLNSFITQYEALIENIDNVPNHIKNNVRNQYNGDYFMPVLLNGDSPNNTNNSPISHSPTSNNAEQYTSVVPSIVIHHT